MNTIAIAHGEYGEYRLIRLVDETDSTYRLDAGGIQLFFDDVEAGNSRKEFTLTQDGKTTATIEAAVTPDTIVGALSYMVDE